MSSNISLSKFYLKRSSPRHYTTFFQQHYPSSLFTLTGPIPIISTALLSHRSNHSIATMKTFTIGFTLLGLASISYAAPGSARVGARQAAENVITFQGAGPNPPSYTETIPNDGSTFLIGTSLPSRPVKQRHTSTYSHISPTHPLPPPPKKKRHVPFAKPDREQIIH